MLRTPPSREVWEHAFKSGGATAPPAPPSPTPLICHSDVDHRHLNTGIMRIPSFIHPVTHTHTKYQDVGNKDIYLAKTKDYINLSYKVHMPKLVLSHWPSMLFCSCGCSSTEPPPSLHTSTADAPSLSVAQE